MPALAHTELERPLGLKESDHVLVALAHPDDEQLLSSGLRLAIAAHIPMTLLYATSGEQSDRGPHDKDVLRRVREQEATRSAIALGLLENVIFLRRPDGRLHTASQQAELPDQLTEYADVLGISMIMTIGSDGVDGHPDHVAVHDASTITARKHRLELLGLHPDGAIHVPVDKAAKLGGFAIHESQFAIDMTDMRTPLPSRQTAALLQTYETRGLFTDERYAQYIHEGNLIIDKL